ncbi:HD-GYP domain-containing protein [Cohnella lupini]|uniref:HD-GYP domain-containing protein (C-di-GMP phosphodiesterase class II) n=1 Tax=Cohnella lupini TaxID=1294267 RepID=A0A3D9IQM6_9BACL|nr:HD-GYP domain-containing protein [Cohnella lupini]RED64042.1 HD-GYP domain-containing protein (c-di-GMP phosphodiesterase class II) [Cohnella lupini]
MRMMPISLSRPGMKLAKKIYSDDGIVLLAEGVELTASLIRRLGECGISFLYIQDAKTEDLVIPELLTDETQRRTIQAIRSAFRDFIDLPHKRKSGNYPYVGHKMRQVMQLIMDDLSRSQDAMIMLMNLHTVDHYLYKHSLNVCVYTTLLGMARGYTHEQLVTLGLGALLHDIGKTQISMQVLLKPGALTAYEFDEMKRHTERGYYLLKDEPNIPLLAAHCAYQHHERINGSGYPRGIKGDEIHDYAKWIGIVDSYDAMTSHRVYRNAMLPHQAVEALYSGSDILYDTSMLQLFRDKVAIYPIGLTVKLNTGQSAVVSDINSTCVHRPVIRVLTDEYGMELKSPFDMDLSKNLNVLISKIELGTEEISPITA